MKTIVHLGPHRCATTTFQKYLRRNRSRLGEQGVVFWGPESLRREGLFKGLYAGPSACIDKAAVRAARQRIAKAFAEAEQHGAQVLIISEENMLGSIRGNLRQAGLYPDARLRLSAFARALGRPVDRVVFGLRPLQDYWASALAYAVKRGAALPDAGRLRKLAFGPRSWQDVLEDVAAVFPWAWIELHRFADFADAPDARLRVLLGDTAHVPRFKPDVRFNEAPDLPALRALLSERGIENRLPLCEGRWQPFDRAERSALGEIYSDDLFAFRASRANRLQMIDKTGQDTQTPDDTGLSPALAATRGQGYDQARRMGRAG